MAKRKSTGKRQRFNIFKRDGFTCQYCGKTPPDVVLVVDHILPVASGGETVEHNLITACETCNQGKADGLLSSVPRSIDDTLAQQIERQEQLAEYNRHLLALRRERDRMARDIGVEWESRKNPETAGQFTFNAERLATILRFMDRLPISEIYDAIDAAFARCAPTRSTGYDKNTFSYFCGVCWNKIRKREGTDG